MESPNKLPPSCFICLNSIDLTRRPGPSSQILKQNTAAFSTLGKVFHVSKVFIDPFLSSSRGGERPLQCLECSTSLKELSDVQQTVGSLSDEVLQLQNQLLRKLKQLAKVVGVTRRNKKSIHSNLLKTERQLQNLMRGGGFGGVISPELYSLRQLILGALMMSGSDDHVPEIPENCSSSTSFPNNFAIQDSTKKGGLEEFSGSHVKVKVENVQTTNQNENEGNFEGEDGWNGYILLNENEPAQPDDNDTEFIYADDNEEEEIVMSEDAGSDYTPSGSKRKKVERNSKRPVKNKRRRTDDDDSCSDSDGEGISKDSEKKSSGGGGGGRSIIKTLNRIETQLSNHEETLRKLLRNKTLFSRLEGRVENEVKQALASLKCDEASGTVDVAKFNGLVDQVENCFSNNAALRKEMVEMTSSFQGSLDEVANNATNPNSYQIKWPIRSVKDIEIVEKQLEDPAVFQAEVQSLARVGGNKKSKIIYNTLRSIVTHEFAKEIRFTNKTGKIAFGDLKMAALVRDAIKTGNPSKHFTDDHINEKVGAWFRQSVDRSKSLGKGGQGNKSLSKSTTSIRTDKAEVIEDSDLFQSSLLDL